MLGLFKLCGIGVVCEVCYVDGVWWFVLLLGGNVGIVVVYCGCEFGVLVCVVVLESVLVWVCELICVEGVEFVVYGVSWVEVNVFV